MSRDKLALATGEIGLTVEYDIAGG